MFSKIYYIYLYFTQQQDMTNEDKSRIGLILDRNEIHKFLKSSV